MFSKKATKFDGSNLTECSKCQIVGEDFVKFNFKSTCLHSYYTLFFFCASFTVASELFTSQSVPTTQNFGKLKVDIIQRCGNQKVICCTNDDFSVDDSNRVV